MKKLIMIAAMAVFGLSSAQEGFKLGAHIGVPVAYIVIHRHLTSRER